MRTELRHMLRERPGRGGVWLFAYGSLLWNPEIDHSERVLARVHGWHRRFCLWQWSFRGSPAQPNLMLALDAGGACNGVLLRVPGGADLADRLEPVWKRELGAFGYLARWVLARVAGRQVAALAFVANRGNRQRYAGRVDRPLLVDCLASAEGESGSGAEYLCNTVAALRRAGAPDTTLERLWSEVERRVDERRRPSRARLPG